MPHGSRVRWALESRNGSHPDGIQGTLKDLAFLLGLARVVIVCGCSFPELPSVLVSYSLILLHLLHSAFFILGFVGHCPESGGG